MLLPGADFPGLPLGRAPVEQRHGERQLRLPHAALDHAFDVQAQLLQLEGALAGRDHELQRDRLARRDGVVVAIGRRARADAQVAPVHRRRRDFAVEADRQLRLQRLHQQREVGLSSGGSRARRIWFGRLLEPADERRPAQLHARKQEARREQRFEPVAARRRRPARPDEPGGVSLSAMAVAARLPAAACGGSRKSIWLDWSRSSVPSGRKSPSTTMYASLSRPPVRLVTMPVSAPWSTMQVGLDARRLFELAVDLRRGELALLERHVVERRLGALADAERPARIGLVARAREREVQPAAQVLGRQHEVERAVVARQHRDVLVGIRGRAVADVDRAHDDHAGDGRVGLGALAGDDEGDRAPRRPSARPSTAGSSRPCRVGRRRTARAPRPTPYTPISAQNQSSVGLGCVEKSAIDSRGAPPPQRR